MKKRLVCVAALLMAVGTLAGCQGKTADVDVNALATELHDGIEYVDELSELDLDTAAMFYSFQDADIAEACLYESSGATAEEIVVIKCATAADAAKVHQAFDTRITEQIENFTDYVPGEVEKLNAAVIVEKGNYAVLSVSDDAGKAKEIIGKYIK